MEEYISIHPKNVELCIEIQSPLNSFVDLTLIVIPYDYSSLSSVLPPNDNRNISSDGSFHHTSKAPVDNQIINQDEKTHSPSSSADNLSSHRDRLFHYDNMLNNCTADIKRLPTPHPKNSSLPATSKTDVQQKHSTTLLKPTISSSNKRTAPLPTTTKLHQGKKANFHRQHSLSHSPTVPGRPLFTNHFSGENRPTKKVIATLQNQNTGKIIHHSSLNTSAAASPQEKKSTEASCSSSPLVHHQHEHHHHHHHYSPTLMKADAPLTEH